VAPLHSLHGTRHGEKAVRAHFTVRHAKGQCSESLEVPFTRLNEHGRAQALSTLCKIQKNDSDSNHVILRVAISACERALAWTWALSLLEQARRSACDIGVDDMNYAASACEQSGQWTWAMHLLSDLQRLSLEPDSASHSIVERALRKQHAVSAGVPGSSNIVGSDEAKDFLTSEACYEGCCCGSLDGTLCSTVVFGPMRRRLVQFLISALGDAAGPALAELERVCSVSALCDHQRLESLGYHLRQNDIAPLWIDHAHPNNGRHTAELVRELMLGTPLCRVLDYGAGDGTDAAAVARELHLGPESVWAIDIGRRGPSQDSRDYINYISLQDPIEQHLAEIGQELAGTLDAVWSFGVLHHINDLSTLNAALGTIAAVLRPGGTFIVEEWALPELRGSYLHKAAAGASMATRAQRESCPAFFDWVHLLNGVIFVEEQNDKPNCCLCCHELPDEDLFLASYPVEPLGTHYRCLSDWLLRIEAFGFRLDWHRSSIASGGTLGVQSARGVAGGFVAVFTKCVALQTSMD